MDEPFDSALFEEGKSNMEVFCFDYQRLQVEDICAGLEERSSGALHCVFHVDSKASPRTDVRDFLTKRLAVSYPYYALYDEKQAVAMQGPLIYDIPDIIERFGVDEKKK